MKKRRKIMILALVFLALAGIILLVFPYQKQISCRGTAYARKTKATILYTS